MIFPLRIYKGRGDLYINLTYQLIKKPYLRCVGWGVIYSDTIFSLGDKLITYRFKSSEEHLHTIKKKKEETLNLDYYFSEDKVGLKPKEYYFIDFGLDKNNKEVNCSSNKILKASLDIRPETVASNEIQIILINSVKDDNIFGLGKIDFLKEKIELEFLRSSNIKILGFFI